MPVVDRRSGCQASTLTTMYFWKLKYPGACPPEAPSSNLLSSHGTWPKMSFFALTRNLTRFSSPGIQKSTLCSPAPLFMGGGVPKLILFSFYGSRNRVNTRRYIFTAPKVLIQITELPIHRFVCASGFVCHYSERCRWLHPQAARNLYVQSQTGQVRKAQGNKLAKTALKCPSDLESFTP